MKYLKRFNEELKPQTYRNAARKLNKLGHGGRADALKKWSKEKENEENIKKWKKEIEEYSKYGTYKLRIKNPKNNKELIGDFHLDIIFDETSFIESIGDEGSGIWFMIGIIPTSEELLRECNEVLPDPDMGNGFYWALGMEIIYKVENNKIELSNFNIHNYDTHVGGDVSIADRGSAGRLRNLLKKIFSDPNLNYPSGYTNADTLYEVLQRSILVESGFSSDYGFTLEDVASYINTISPNTMYKS